MKFLTSIDLVKNELQNAVIQNLAVAPATPKEGQIYYNSAEHALYQYKGETLGWAMIGVEYTLPIASADTLGGVKVGAGLQISEQGALSVTGGGVADSVEWSGVLDTPTTLAGYGIVDAKIADGVITLGTDTITPVVSVNGKTGGTIVLAASDVGALSSDYKPTFYVNATVNASDTTTTLDKTPEQIYAAYNEGKDVYCIVNAGAHLILPLVIATGVTGGGDLMFKSSFSQGISNAPANYQQITLELFSSSGSSTDSIWDVIRTILPTKTSQLNNDSGFLTLDTLPKYTGGVS